MNIAISDVCSQANDTERGKIEIIPVVPFATESKN